MRSFSRDEDKHKTVNKGCPEIRRGKFIARTFKIVRVPVLGGAMPGGTTVTVWGGYDISDRFWRDRNVTEEVKYEDNS